MSQLVEGAQKRQEYSRFERMSGAGTEGCSTKIESAITDRAAIAAHDVMAINYLEQPSPSTTPPQHAMQSDASTASPDSPPGENPLWDSTPPTSLAAPISPPQLESPRPPKRPKRAPSPTLAAVEAGEAVIDDHLAYFTKHLSRVTRPCVSGVPRLSIAEFGRLYERNSIAQGHHFVIHQHDHPVAGVHYDLRLQFSESSSISFAIPFGVPGNANSVRMGRMAMETRVHNYWNHLIESASHATGSLLIWDTGEYSILPSSQSPTQRKTKKSYSDSDSDSDSSPSHNSINPNVPENEKLQQAFRTGKFRLRLHGTRLPQNYTIVLRLTDFNPNSYLPARPAPKRKRRRRTGVAHRSPSRQETLPPSDAESTTADLPEDIAATPATVLDANASALGKELAEQEDEQMRRTNAYPGAANTIGSVHQRSWHLSLDKPSSGFVREEGDGPGAGRKRWVRSVERGSGKARGFEAFYVRGREVERSVVTGRAADEVCADEGVVGFVVRKGWRAVLE